MLWILLLAGYFVALAFLGASIHEIFDSPTDWHDVRGCVIGMVICAALGTVGLLGLGGIDSLSYTEVSQTGDWELASITDNSQISGKGSCSLFYVHASIDTNEVYSFYYKLDDGGFKRGTTEAKRTVIYEKDDCTPHIVEYTTYTRNKMNKVLRGILAFGYGETSQKTYEIYTPKGTILRTFSLDTQ